MDTIRHLAVAEVARFEEKSPEALLLAYRRKGIVLPVDPEDTRKKLVPVSLLSPTAYQAWVNAETCAALQNVNGQSTEALSSEETAKQPPLPFATPSQTERAMLKAVPAAIPERYQPYIDRWAMIVGDCANGTWRKYQGRSLGGITIQCRQDFIRAQAKIYGKGYEPSTIHGKLKVLKDVNHNPDIPASQKMAEFWNRILLKNRPVGLAFLL